MNGAELICETLGKYGVRHVFGLPGTQNARLFSELRRSPIDVLVTTHEMSAGFAALGYAATSSIPAVMAIIGGPGFAYALTPLLEARQDSIPLVCLVFIHRSRPDKAFHTQHVDYRSIAGAACKEILEESSTTELASTLVRAMAIAMGGEPGPVVVLVDSGLLEKRVTAPVSQIPLWLEPNPVEEPVRNVVARIRGQSVLLFVGRGSLGCASEIVRLAERLGAPVLTSTSARGVIPENHPLAVKSDLVSPELINQFIAEFDCVVALGIKFSENSTRGFRLQIPPEKLVHIDQGPDVVARNFEASVHAVTHVPTFVKSLLERDLQATPADESDLAEWRSRFQSSLTTKHKVEFEGLQPSTAAHFFEVLRANLPDDSILVTDCGNHQVMARRYYSSLCPHGLLVPSGFQSMGFALSAALGAKLAHQDRTVVALIGDGGFQMSALELAAAVRAGLDILVIVFNDGHFSQIRHAQLDYDGHECGVALPSLDIAAFAESIGADYSKGPTGLVDAVNNSAGRRVPAIVEIVLHELISRSSSMKIHAKRILKSTVSRLNT
jgi:acetolactate synthase-1/2/3 large subunit